MPIDFVAIDFETANSDRDSACALGVACVEGGKIVSRHYTLLNPQTTFHDFCTYIHGINESAVKDAPDFGEIFPALYQMLEGKRVVAHNAGFDVGVLEASCQSRNLPMPDILPYDSVDMARTAWPHLEKHKLSALAKTFNLPLKNHNAAEDATACAMLVLKACQEFQADSLEELILALEKKAARDAARRQAEAKRQAKLIQEQKRSGGGQ